MKISLFFVLFLFFSVDSVFAHIEPTLTLTQKIRQSSERIRYKIARVQKVETIMVGFIDTTQSYRKSIERYDLEGNVIEQLFFHKNQNVISKAQLEYDHHKNMRKQSNFDSTNQLVGYALYEYDEGGRIQSYQEYNSNDRLVAQFVYERFPDQSRIVLTKFNPSEERMYTVTYKLVDGVDGFVKTILKTTDGADSNEQVIYDYDFEGNVSKKSVYKNRELRWRWLYEYDENHNQISVTKELPNGTIELRFETKYDDKNFPINSVQYAQGTMIQKLIYRYQYYSSKQ